MKTQVTIAIDTEFSIAGALRDFERYKPVADPCVLCFANGQENGLGFLLDTFEAYEISCTFFVEAINVRYFGYAPMGKIAKRILERGQDVQLHVHPIWNNFKDGLLQPQGNSTSDNCSGRTTEELKGIFELGLQVFEAWNIPKPIAIRTGNFATDLNVFRVMNQLGIPLASNINMGVFSPPEPELCVTGGRHIFDGVLELPSLAFVDLPKLRPNHLRPLQITSCSWKEIEYILWQSRKQNIEHVVILTHPFEFIKRADIQYRDIRENILVKSRLKQLCEFLHREKHDFETLSFAEGKERWLAKGSLSENTLISSDLIAFQRMAENKFNDIFH